MDASNSCKIDTLVDTYDLDEYESRYSSLDNHLIARWIGEERPSQGYRSLATWFNKRLLKRAYEQAGRETTGTRLESEYEALTGDDDLLRQEVLDELEVDGINGDQILDDMVSFGTVRNHLQNCLDATKETQSAETEWEQQSIEKARSVTAEKAESALKSLSNKDKLPGGEEASINIQILLSCPECPTRVPFQAAADRGFICPDHLGVAPEEQLEP